MSELTWYAAFETVGGVIRVDEMSENRPIALLVAVGEPGKRQGRRIAALLTLAVGVSTDDLEAGVVRLCRALAHQ